MILAFIGPPGSGKGTQAVLIADKMGLSHLSTGEVLRTKATSGTPDGDILQKTMASGKLVSSDLVNDLVLNALQSSKKGCILDGYPRNLDQVKFLSKHCAEEISSIYFNLPRDIIVKRITGRFSCAQCGKIYNSYFYKTKIDGECDACRSSNFIFRKDDSEKAIVERLEAYDAETKPVIDHYRQLGLLKTINANAPLSEITEELYKLLKK